MTLSYMVRCGWACPGQAGPDKAGLAWVRLCLVGLGMPPQGKVG
jgi:hypothetical protein